MKKRELVKKLRALGWRFLREGSNHELWTNGVLKQPVPRHKEVGETLAKSILKIARENPGGERDQ